MTLEEKLRVRRFVVTAEVTPPVSADPADLFAKALPLKGLADAVNITDGAGARPHLAALTSAALLAANGIESVLQFTCRDRNRIALQSDLLGAAASDIRNLLMIRGDNPGAGDQPDAKPVFDLDPRQLLDTARKLRDTGELLSGRKISGRAKFFLGAADNPVDPPPGWKPDALAAKLAAGAQFVQTQFCMDAGLVRRYTARLADAGLAGKLSLIIGVVPLRSVKSALWIREKLFGAVIPQAIVDRMEQAADPVAEGRRICLETVQQLSDVPHVAGVHIMAPGNDAVVPDLIADVRESVSRLALV
jgi:methylenetetrahydrofolate reductase (NADPH)